MAALEAAKAAILVVREVQGLTEKQTCSVESSKNKRAALRQPFFVWKVCDKYNELNNFKN